MSQRNVEVLIGRLATDEALRDRFASDRWEVLREAAQEGLVLNPCEQHALAGLDPRALRRFAEAVGQKLQKSDLRARAREEPGGDGARRDPR
jgi:hypothetical protein